MINNKIAINDIQIKDDNTIFNVEIKDDAETMIAAHNSSQDAHKNIIENLVQKTQSLSNIVNEIEDNIVLSSEIPAKLSELENDMKFVSEETLISALEKRNMVTLPQLNEKIEENKNELKDLIDINSGIITNKIETVKNELAESCSPETISTLIQPSDNYLLLTITQTLQSYTMPADGTLYFLGKSYSGGTAWVRLARGKHKDYFVQGNIPVAGNYGTASLMVNKGEVVEVAYSFCEPRALIFIYNNAWAQKIEESEEQ